MQQIKIRGARTHNLKNINLNLPRNQLVVITGLSGSGKSSLAFDTLYAESQRRYVESLSAYARQFLGVMNKPDVDYIEGLSPALAITQKVNAPNPRTTVGTITEIYDYLRLLFAKVGQVQCPTHKHILNAQTISQMVDSILLLPEATKLMILAPLVSPPPNKVTNFFQDLYRQGFLRARIDGTIYELAQLPLIDWQRPHNIAVIVDRLKVSAANSSRFAASLETALNLAAGIASVALWDSPEQDRYMFSANFACHECAYRLPEITPSLFAFNTPEGACQDCKGLGSNQDLDPQTIISNPQLSLAQGVIPYWRSNAKHNYQQMLHCVARHYNFSLNTPFAALAPAIQQIILYGSNEQIAFNIQDGHGNNFSRTQQFIGAIPYLKRRYQETESAAVRAALGGYFTSKACDSCNGERLCQAARYVIVAQHNLPTIVNWPITQTLEFFNSLALPGSRGTIAAKILQELKNRLGFLIDVGLGYLTLNRSATTLSGGEAQRIRLASQIGSGLVGVMYVLDEPSMGLHQRDNAKLLRALQRLRDLGNTVIMVEHDAEAIMAADYIVDLGPGAGSNGGEVVATGNAATIMQTPASLTGQYLRRSRQIAAPSQRLPPNPQQMITITGACHNNLKNITVSLPIGLLCGITGVSGSGKSTLINDTLMPVAAHILNGSALNNSSLYPQITGLTACDRLVVIDQSPIGRTPRSNPATYSGIFTPMRQLFAGVPTARARGYQDKRFSFNVPGGRCEACQGDGVMKVEMHFLADVYVECDVCQGKRYNRETLEILYKGKNIHQVLTMTVTAAYEFFTAVPMIASKLKLLLEVGLGYLTLGQNATTLSGGEAQRVKLAKELSRRDTGKTLYLLDEPTTGLHFHDIAQLLIVLQRLRDHGNTIIIIEHNLDVIKACDWLVDLGPEGGEHGGKILAVGTPEQVAQNQYSHTGVFLNKIFQQLKLEEY